MLQVIPKLRSGLIVLLISQIHGYAHAQTVNEMEMACALAPRQYKECENLTPNSGSATARVATPQIIKEYLDRKKTILEQILNYSVTSKEEGTELHFWTSGENGTHKCVMTEYKLLGKSAELDIRTLNELGFSIELKRSAGRWVWRIGDEKQFIVNEGEPNQARLQRAWGMAFDECPGKKSAF